MITRLQVQHYKSLENLDLELPDLAVFVGPNGTGKSNLIDALRFLRDAAVSGLDHAVSERHGIDSVRQWSPGRPYDVTLNVQVKSPLGLGRLAFTLASKGGRHEVKREDAAWGPKGSDEPFFYCRSRSELYSVGLGEAGKGSFPEQPDELFLRQPEARALRPLVDALASFEAYSIFPNVLRTPQRPSNDPRLAPDGGNLPSVFKALTRSKKREHRRARDEIVAALRQVLPALDSLRIQSLGGLSVPVFRVREADGKLHDFNVSQVSDGTLRVFGLLTALYQPSRPAAIALEEPEQNVHPGVLAVLAEAAREIRSESQVLITTHSPELVDRFDPENVLAVELEGAVTRVGPVSSHQAQAVKDRLFSLGELMSAEGLHP